MEKNNVPFFVVGGLAALLLCVALGYGLGTQSGNVSSLLSRSTNENAGKASNPDDTERLIESMKQAYEDMLRERKEKAKSKPSSSSAVVPEIIMFTRSDCVECKRWLGQEAERFRRLGWRVALSEDKEYRYSRVPHFLVTDCARSVEVSGFMTVERLAEVLR